MYTIRGTEQTKEECLRRALEYEWLMENCTTLEGEGYFWHRARYWKSMYYAAKKEPKPI
jgi:hypothetical protein